MFIFFLQFVFCLPTVVNYVVVVVVVVVNVAVVSLLVDFVVDVDDVVCCYCCCGFLRNSFCMSFSCKSRTGSLFHAGVDASPSLTSITNISFSSSSVVFSLTGFVVAFW